MKDTGSKIRKGKLVNAYGTQITWISVEGDECQHILTQDARITLDGKPSKLGDLRVGMPVRVTVCDADESKTSFIAAEKIKTVPYT